MAAAAAVATKIQLARAAKGLKRTTKDNSAAVAEFWHAFPLRSDECDFARFADYIAEIRENLQRAAIMKF